MVVLHVLEGVLWSIHYAELAWVHPSANMRKHIWDVAFNIIDSFCDVPRDVYRIIHKVSSASRRHYVKQQLMLSSIWRLMFEVFIWITMVSAGCLCECTCNCLWHMKLHLSKKATWRAFCHRAENPLQVCPYSGTDYFKFFEFKVLRAALWTPPPYTFMQSNCDRTTKIQ